MDQDHDLNKFTYPVKLQRYLEIGGQNKIFFGTYEVWESTSFLTNGLASSEGEPLSSASTLDDTYVAPPINVPTKETKKII